MVQPIPQRVVRDRRGLHAADRPPLSPEAQRLQGIYARCGVDPEQVPKLVLALTTAYGGIETTDEQTLMEANREILRSRGQRIP